MRRTSPLLVSAFLALAGCEMPPPPPVRAVVTAHIHRFSIDVAALPGRTNEIRHWVALNGDCSVAGIFDVHVVLAPLHGQAQVVNGAFFPNYGRLDTRAACDATRHGGVALQYTPAPGYAGPDQLAFSIVTPDGRYWTTDVNIVVPPQAP